MTKALRSFCCVPFCTCGLPRHPDTLVVERMREADAAKAKR